VTTIRFLHTADWQLGMRRHYLDEEALPRYMQARIDAVAAMAKLARECDCAFSIVCGDVFESNQVDRRTIGRTLEALAEFPGPVYLLPGNHDPLDAGSVYRSGDFARRPSGVRLLDTNDLVEVSNRVELVGVPWHSRHPRRDLVAEACARLEARPGVLRVCVAHGAVDREAPDPDDPALISVASAERALHEGRIHYLALGDRHSVTEVAPRIWYSGTPLATGYRETDPGQALVVELDERHCTVERHRVGSWRFLERSLQLESSADLDELEEWLAALADKPCTVVKLRLTGSLGLADRARLESLLEQAGELLAALEQRRDALVVLPAEPDLAALDLAGFARAAVDELAEKAAGDDEEAGVARDSLALLYRLRAVTERETPA
jgi:DNA repair exonuclease SbcCD nuclease subunit